MEAESWRRFTGVSGRQQNAIQSRFAADLYMGFEEVDGGEDEYRGEFPCPFCSEDFDIVELCCHIDEEHPVEDKNGVCPVCEDKVGMDMVEHITMQHANFFKMQHRRRSRKSSGSHYMLSLLKKELWEGNIPDILGGSSYHVPPNAAPDPLLSSFIYNFPIVDPVKDVQAQTSDEEIAVSKILDSKPAESIEPPVSDKYHEEKARRSEFVRELVLSTILDGRL